MRPLLKCLLMNSNSFVFSVFVMFYCLAVYLILLFFHVWSTCAGLIHLSSVESLYEKVVDIFLFATSEPLSVPVAQDSRRNDN